jgi:hypothetical protein
MTTSHTPTPWIVNGKSIEYGEGLSGGLVAACVEDVFGNSIDDADMAHIVRCVNAHDDLVAALKDLDDCYCEVGGQLTHVQRANHRKVLMQARAALEKATK